MKTYEDWIRIETEADKQDFIYSAINAHKMSTMYKDAEIAEQYARHRNVTINEFQKILYTMTGKAVPDNWSANYKMACRHFYRFITQENQTLLGNGINWKNEASAEKLGTKKKRIDRQLQEMGKNALIMGISFGFYNLDHIEVFKLTEFVPIYDENNGALRLGVRFWQIDSKKPLRATLYEEDGYTEYMWKDGDCEILQDKRAYVLTLKESKADGTEIYDGWNYPTLPIVPMWGNPEHQSELVGLREQIDCYDLIKSGFANTVDEASLVYWVIQNGGGMDDVDLAKFVERIKTVHAAVVEDDGAKAESHTQEAPYQSREALLERLDRDLYRDAMALDIDRIAAGAITATQIRASYEALNSKLDEYEYCVLDFLNRIMELAGVDDEPTFTRSRMVNASEEIATIVSAAPFLPAEYVTEKVLTILGDVDRIDDIINQMHANELEMM